MKSRTIHLLLSAITAWGCAATPEPAATGPGEARAVKPASQPTRQPDPAPVRPEAAAAGAGTRERVQKQTPVARTTPAAPRIEVVETVETDADRLLQYYAYMVELQGDSLQREYRRVQKAIHADPNEFNQMQLIMLLSSPSATFRDTGHAQVLIKAWLNDEYNTYSKLRPLAVLFGNYLGEVNQLDYTHEQTRNSLDKAVNELEQAVDQISMQRQELAAEKRRSSALERKLEALLEVEKTLIERKPKPSSQEP
jgi:hypothetical protein